MNQGPIFLINPYFLDAVQVKLDPPNGDLQFQEMLAPLAGKLGTAPHTREEPFPQNSEKGLQLSSAASCTIALLPQLAETEQEVALPSQTFLHVGLLETDSTLFPAAHAQRQEAPLGDEHDFLKIAPALLRLQVSVPTLTAPLIVS